MMKPENKASPYILAGYRDDEFGYSGILRKKSTQYRYILIKTRPKYYIAIKQPCTGVVLDLIRNPSPSPFARDEKTHKMRRENQIVQTMLMKTKY